MIYAYALELDFRVKSLKNKIAARRQVRQGTLSIIAIDWVCLARAVPSLRSRRAGASTIIQEGVSHAPAEINTAGTSPSPRPKTGSCFGSFNCVRSPCPSPPAPLKKEPPKPIE